MSTDPDELACEGRCDPHDDPAERILVAGIDAIIDDKPYRDHWRAGHWLKQLAAAGLLVDDGEDPDDGYDEDVTAGPAMETVWLPGDEPMPEAARLAEVTALVEATYDRWVHGRDEERLFGVLARALIDSGLITSQPAESPAHETVGGADLTEAIETARGEYRRADWANRKQFDREYDSIMALGRGSTPLDPIAEAVTAVWKIWVARRASDLADRFNLLAEARAHIEELKAERDRLAAELPDAGQRGREWAALAIEAAARRGEEAVNGLASSTRFSQLTFCQALRTAANIARGTTPMPLPGDPGYRPVGPTPAGGEAGAWLELFREAVHAENRRRIGMGTSADWRSGLLYALKLAKELSVDTPAGGEAESGPVRPRYIRETPDEMLHRARGIALDAVRDQLTLLVMDGREWMSDPEGYLARSADAMHRVVAELADEWGYPPAPTFGTEADAAPVPPAEEPAPAGDLEAHDVGRYTDERVPGPLTTYRAEEPAPAEGPIEYVNLTPHEIVVRDPDGTTTAYPSTGAPARIAETAHEELGPDAHRRVVVRLGELNGLPPYRPGVVHIVSMPCAMALAAARSTRPDVVYPYELYRDDAGRTQGALALARIEVTS